MNSLKWLKGLKNLRIGAVTGTGTGSNPATLNGPEAGSQQQGILSRLPQHVSTGPLSSKKPKRPLSPYLRFAMAERTNVVKDNPTLKVTQIMSLLGQKWANLDDSEKAAYIRQFQEELPQYSKILAEYKKSLTESDIEAMKKEKLQKELRKEKRVKRERVRDLGKPKKPPTPFLAFVMSKAQKGVDPKSYAESCKNLAKEWNGLTDEAKKPYVDAYNKDKQKYETELQKWEQKMLKLGNTDVVRLSTAKTAKAGKED